MGDVSRLAGRRVLITGAASGIGLAAARAFAAEGAALALLDRNEAALAPVADALGAVAIPCDVAREAAVPPAVDAACTALGGLDGLVNAAGICLRGAVETFSDADWRLTLDVNLLGPMLVCRAAIPALRASGRATIVNLASIGALRPARDVSAYCVSKAGILMLSKCLAFELGPTIRVNAVCPGTIETPMTAPLLADPVIADRLTSGPALRRVGVPEEIAATLLHLTSHESSYTNGATLVVDGGQIWL